MQLPLWPMFLFHRKRGNVGIWKQSCCSRIGSQVHPAALLSDLDAMRDGDFRVPNFRKCWTWCSWSCVNNIECYWKLRYFLGSWAQQEQMYCWIIWTNNYASTFWTISVISVRQNAMQKFTFYGLALLSSFLSRLARPILLWALSKWRC